MKTTFSKSKEQALKDRAWHIVDAADVPVGRLASEVATLIRGKHKADFTPHVDGGDFVIVVNAEKARFTGNKMTQKHYHHHTGYVGGIKSISAAEQFEKHPTRVIEKAVKGMVPRGALGHQMIKKLKVYAGSEHPHSAQNPEVFELRYYKGRNAAA